MEYLDISQVSADEREAAYICTLEVKDGMFERIQRMPLNFREDTQQLRAFDVLIDEVDASGDLIGESPVVIPAHKAKWLLGEFFKVSPKAVKAIKNPTTE